MLLKVIKITMKIEVKTPVSLCLYLVGFMSGVNYLGQY